MKIPVLKGDIAVATKQLSQSSQSLPQYLIDLIKSNLAEANIQCDEAEVEQIVKDNCFLMFTVSDVLFRIKLL